VKKGKRILIIFLVVIFCSSLFTICLVSYSKNDEGEDKNYLSSNDPDVILIREIINKSNFLKKNPGDKDNFTKEDVLYLVLDMISEDDYIIQSYEKKKLTCQVTDKTFFTVSGECQIKTISLETLNKLQEKYLETSVDLSNLEINYKGLVCKYDNSNYYCLQEEYQDENYYVLFDKAYREEDIIYLQFYILANEVIKDNEEDLQVDDEIIKDKGALIKYEFKKTNEGYIYLRSYVG